MIAPYYDDGTVQIFHGRAEEVITALTGIDAVMTDPPYGVGLKAKRAKQRGGGVSVRVGEYSFDDTPEYVQEVVIPIIAACRLIAKRVVVTPGSRNLWLYPPADDLGVFYSAAGTGMGRWGFVCSQPILFYGSDPYLAAGMGSRPNSCGQTYPNDANQYDHPCAKPMPWARWLVTRASLEGMTVLDPFMGSGAILQAAKDLGRKAIGIDISEKYCEIAARRLSQEVFDFEALV